jgi:ABC-type lipopolysaccharide export system ATPase subunit
LVDTAIAINQGGIITQGNFSDVMDNETVRSSYLGTA